MVKTVSAAVSQHQHGAVFLGLLNIASRAFCCVDVQWHALCSACSEQLTNLTQNRVQCHIWIGCKL